jgi:hypothetical protein
MMGEAGTMADGVAGSPPHPVPWAVAAQPQALAAPKGQYNKETGLGRV